MTQTIAIRPHCGSLLLDGLANCMGNNGPDDVLRDPYSTKPYVPFYTTKRVGGGIQDFDAIKLLKFDVS